MLNYAFEEINNEGKEFQNVESTQEHPNANLSNTDLPRSIDNEKETVNLSLDLDEISNTDTGLPDEPLIKSSSPKTNGSKQLYVRGEKFVKKRVSPCLKIYMDQSGSFCNLFQGMSLMFLLGSFLGIVMPKNPDLPTPAYRVFSSIIGYTYFVCWSVSFYPQVITNYQLKSVDGLSVDSQVMAVLNYLCYTLYTAEFFWNQGIRDEYKTQHGEDAKITVQSNDVAFALNGLLLSTIILAQIAYYQGFSIYSLTHVTIGLITGVTMLCMVYVIGILFHFPGFLWIDFFYILSFIKLAFTICTYVPQIMYNMKRQSTEGFNIWNPFLDFMGGILSLVQIVGDSVDLHDFTGITGNWVKFLLGIVSLIFDIWFFLQHYVFYHNNRISNNSIHTQTPAMIFQEFYESQELV